MSKTNNQTEAAVVVLPPEDSLPPVIGEASDRTRRRVFDFYSSIHEIFERWVKRSPSYHTQRSYRKDILSFIEFLGWRWPDDAAKLLSVYIAQVEAWRESMVNDNAAPKTINRRLASLSSFYKFLAGCASEARLPINIPNPAHVQFIKRLGSDPVRERHALSATRARQLMGMPRGESLVEYRDRAIIKTFLYTGVRIGTLQRLNVSHFHDDDENATLEVHEKGEKHRVIGIHYAAAEALRSYIKEGNLEGGPLFRSQKSAWSKDLLSEKRMSGTTLWGVVNSYLTKLPKSVTEEDEGKKQFRYTPHSLRSTAATLLLDAGVDIAKVQELLGHRHITTTQIYDKRRRTTKESASHDMPL